MSQCNQPTSVAIIVPTYNVEQYLEECLQSIKDQSFTDWHCYIVNDGSTDFSPVIATAFAEKDSRFIVLHKENGGVSSARNLGLQQVFKGNYEFIAFLDSDDVFPLNYLEAMVTALKQENADMAICPIVMYDKNGPINSGNSDSAIYQVLDGDLIADMYFLSGKGQVKTDYNRGLGNKIFRLSCVQGKYFREHMKGAEDQDWMIDNLLQVQRAVCTPETKYLYRQRNSSLAHSAKYLQDYETFHRIMLSTYPQYSPFVQECIQNRFIETFYNQILLAIGKGACNDDVRKKISEGKRIISNRFKQNTISSRERKRLKKLSWPIWLLRLYVRYWPKKQRESTKSSYFD